MFYFVFIFSSCSHKFQIIELKSGYNLNASSKNLNLFKVKSNIIFKEIKDREIQIELKKIKQISTRENIIPSSVLSYAFVTRKDTLFASGDLKYWYYKGKVQMYSSKIVNTETIETLMGNIGNVSN